MANSVDPDQTAPIGAVCSGSTLFASILNSSVMLVDFCSRRHQQTAFSDAFFLGALRVKIFKIHFSLTFDAFGMVHRVYWVTAPTFQRNA